MGLSSLRSSVPGICLSHRLLCVLFPVPLLPRKAQEHQLGLGKACIGAKFGLQGLSGQGTHAETVSAVREGIDGDFRESGAVFRPVNGRGGKRQQAGNYLQAENYFSLFRTEGFQVLKNGEISFNGETQAGDLVGLYMLHIMQMYSKNTKKERP